MIMARRDLPLTHSACLRNKEGRVLALDLKLRESSYIVISLYTPTQDKPREQIPTLERLEEFLTWMEPTNLIIRGYFNYILNPTLDKTTSTPTPPASDAVRSKISSIMEESGESEPQ